MDDPTNVKKNGNGNGNGKPKETAQMPEETKKEIADQQAGAEKAAAKAKAEKKNGKKTEKGKKGKLLAFEPKPIPEAVKPIAEAIEKVSNLAHLKAVARVLKRHFKKVYEAACKKAVEGLKAGNVVWFKHGSKLLEGKVEKEKSTGKVKIDVDGKTWRVAGTAVHKGKPTVADKAEVTKKAA